jgi:dipeptidyl aminopeptidase/acylaminoacyl peptidase
VAYPGKLVFLTPAGNVGTMKPDGSGVKLLQNLPGANVRLSPDHSVLGLVDVNQRDLSVIDLSSSGDPRRLAWNVASWTWSPDSRQIAYSTLDGPAQIYVAWVDSRTAPRQITHNARPSSATYFAYRALAWSPDGNRIAFVNWQNYGAHTPLTGGRLFTIAPTGKGGERAGPRVGAFATAHELPQSTGFGFVPTVLGWSPDGSALAIASEADAGVAIVRGSRVAWLRGSECCVAPRWLAWSPDGTRLAFLGGDTSIGDAGAVAAVDGSTAVVIAQGSTPVWSPDGRHVAFLRGRTMAIADRNGRHIVDMHAATRISELLAWIR